MNLNPQCLEPSLLFVGAGGGARVSAYDFVDKLPETELMFFLGQTPRNQDQHAPVLFNPWTEFTGKTHVSPAFTGQE